MTIKASATPALGGYVTYQLNTLSKLNDLASQVLYTAETGLTLPEVRALAALGAFERLSVLQLALEVNLDKGQASRLAAAMIDKGLLSRRDDASDKRVVHLVLTRSGRAKWAKVMALIAARNEALLAPLSEAERTTLRTLLARLLDAEKAHAR